MGKKDVVHSNASITKFMQIEKTEKNKYLRIFLDSKITVKKSKEFKGNIYDLFQGKFTGTQTSFTMSNIKIELAEKRPGIDGIWMGCTMSRNDYSENYSFVVDDPLRKKFIFLFVAGIVLYRQVEFVNFYEIRSKRLGLRPIINLEFMPHAASRNEKRRRKYTSIGQGSEIVELDIL